MEIKNYSNKRDDDAQATWAFLKKLVKQMNIQTRHGVFLCCIAVLSALASSCVPVCDSKSVAVFMNNTDDTLYIGASHYGTIDSVDYSLKPAYFPMDNVIDTSKVILWNDNIAPSDVVYPDSLFTIDGDYLFCHTDTCYFFLIKMKDAEKHSWDEIREKKLYRRKTIVRNPDGSFARAIK